MLASVFTTWLRIPKASELASCSCRNVLFTGYKKQSHRSAVSSSRFSSAVWPQGTTSMARQIFDYFLVIDFEATCEQGGKIQPVQEIIEFPVVQIDAKTMSETARFHQYVRPTERPVLTSFCTSLTGILQETVDNGDPLNEIMTKFHDWLVTRALISADDATKLCPWTFVTCGDWDLGVQLPQEANFRRIILPRYFDEWINLKKAFGQAKGYFPNSLSVMLRDLRIEPLGRLHSGIDDVRNMCEILKHIVQDGHVLQNTPAPQANSRSTRLPKFGARRKRREFSEEKAE